MMLEAGKFKINMPALGLGRSSFYIFIWWNVEEQVSWTPFIRPYSYS
jgi:hypothetical protein